MSTELGDPARTNQVCLYKLIDDRPFDECWQPPEDGDFDALEVPELGEALLVFGQPPPKVCGWVGMVRDLTEVHLDHFTTARASALLFVRIEGHGFALSFGDGYRRLDRSAIDRGFGLALALRVIDADTVRHIKREHLTGTGRVDTSSIPRGDALWSFGIREHSELVRRIVGQASAASRMQLSHVQKMAKRGVPPVGIDFADRVRLPLPASPRHLLADLAEIVRVLDEGKVDDDLAPLQWVRRLGPGDRARIDEAWDVALEHLVGGDDDNISLAYPANYHGSQEIGRFEVQIGRNQIVSTGEMDLRFLREALEDHVTRDARLAVLNSGKITGFDDAGNRIAAGVAPLNWLTASVDLADGSRVVLLDGDWFDLTDTYLDHVDRIVVTAFRQRPAWTLPAWRSAPGDPIGKIDEKHYNAHAGAQPGFLCLDRKLVYCRTHPAGFEACDLLGPDNELVHVKRVSSKTGSGPLSHLIAQGIVAIESLTDRATWLKFVEKVAAQDPVRAAALGARPAALVYAIHRSNGLLTPEKLFTFARSEMASAATMLAKLGVPLQICVIP